MAYSSICFRLIGWISSVDNMVHCCSASTVAMGDSPSHEITQPRPSSVACSYQATPTNRELPLAKQPH